jgi:hypothetical protein
MVSLGWVRWLSLPVARPAPSEDDACVVCGASDPLHGMGPAQLMLAGAGLYGAYTSIVRPLRSRLTRQDTRLRKARAVSTEESARDREAGGAASMPA